MTSSAHRYGGTPKQHTRNKTSLGSITYADLANTFSRPGVPMSGLPAIVPQNPPSMIQRQHFQQAEQQKQEVYRKLSSIPTDREIPDDVENMVVGDVVDRYKALRAVERKLDAVMINKRLGARDGGLRYEKRLRVMRIWVRCETKSKPDEDSRMEDSFQFNDSGGPVEYKMRIEGRLLPDLDDDDDEEEDSKPAEESMDVDKPIEKSDEKETSKTGESHKFSHYFKQITITFHPSPSSSGTAPPPSPIEWKQPERTREGGHSTTPDASFDALEITPRFDGPYQKCTITLHRAEGHNRMRGKLSEPLARLLDREYEDKSGAMMGLYNYVRLKGLEEEGQPQKFRCDEQLKAIFKRDVADFIYAPEIIAENIQPLPPIVIPFTIRNAPAGSVPPTIYDVPILVDDPLDVFTLLLRSNTNPHNPAYVQKLSSIAQIDADIALAVQGMQSSKARINFLRQLGIEPIAFLKKWISSQKADEEVILGEEKGRGPEWTRGGPESVWGTQGAKEAIGMMLARPKPQAQP